MRNNAVALTIWNCYKAMKIYSFSLKQSRLLCMELVQGTCMYISCVTHMNKIAFLNKSPLQSHVTYFTALQYNEFTFKNSFIHVTRSQFMNMEQFIKPIYILDR